MGDEDAVEEEGSASMAEIVEFLMSEDSGRLGPGEGGEDEMEASERERLFRVAVKHMVKRENVLIEVPGQEEEPFASRRLAVHPNYVVGE
mmetsp:Transcript_11419/g.28911  ORF Transcript_11419/g.28911 Transcript_11419/m.28911 type:complete len:90 (-) Transcript_11419:134-403(-)